MKLIALTTLLAIALSVMGCISGTEPKSQPQTQEENEAFTPTWNQKVEFYGLFDEVTPPKEIRLDTISKVLTTQRFNAMLDPIVAGLEGEEITKIQPIMRMANGSRFTAVILSAEYTVPPMQSILLATFDSLGRFLSKVELCQMDMCTSDEGINITTFNCITSHGNRQPGCMEMPEAPLEAFTNHFTITPEGKITQSTTPCNK